MREAGQPQTEKTHRCANSFLTPTPSVLGLYDKQTVCGLSIKTWHLTRFEGSSRDQESKHPSVQAGAFSPAGLSSFDH